MKNITKGMTLALSLLFSSASVSAEEGESQAQAFAGYEDAAWQAMDEDLSKVLPEHEISALKLIAYHAVAEILCDGVSMDMERVHAATIALHPENWSELTDDEKKTWGNMLLVNYGMIVGVMLSEHAEKPAPMCAEANEMIADKENDWHYFAVAS